MQTTLFVEASTEWVSLKERSAYIKAMLLQEVFSGFTVAEALQRRNMSLAIATGQGPLDEEFANLISWLNQLEIPVTLWVTLSDEEGYWTNAASVQQTYLRIEEILKWTEEFDVSYVRLGFDIEWPVQIATAVASGKFLKALRMIKAYKKTWNPHAQDRFESILKFLESFGIDYEFYAFPKAMEFMSVTGLTIPEGSRVIEMDYTSFYPSSLASRILRKTRNPNTIPAIGIVNGIPGQTPGRMLSPKLPNHLKAADIKRDFSVISEDGEPLELYVFALNGGKSMDIILEGLNLMDLD